MEMNYNNGNNVRTGANVVVVDGIQKQGPSVVAPPTAAPPSRRPSSRQTSVYAQQQNGSGAPRRANSRLQEVEI